MNRAADAMRLSLRDTPRDDDVRAVQAMVRATGFFRVSEIAIAAELVEEAIAKGAASGYAFLFAEHRNVVVGYSCYGDIPGTQGSYDLYWIVVDPEWQRHGIGGQLLRESEARVREAGGRRLYIETSSQQRYRPTRDFYQRHGYREAARLADFYAPGDSKIIYEKDLTSG